MKTISDLIDGPSLRRLATPADIRLGREIAEQGGVEIVEYSNPFRVLAKARARGGQTRTVELMAADEGLKCRCT